MRPQPGEVGCGRRVRVHQGRGGTIIWRALERWINAGGVQEFPAGAAVWTACTNGAHGPNWEGEVPRLADQSTTGRRNLWAGWLKV